MIKIRKEGLDRAVRNLLKLGFSAYQAKVYAGLLALSETKAPELVDLVDVPKARIYQILDELLEMGVVRKKPGRPIKYAALPPNKGLENMLKWKKEKSERELILLTEAKDGLIEGLHALYGKGETRVATKGFMEIIPAGEISEVETKRAYGSAVKGISVLTGVFEYLPRVISEIEKAVQRGVKVKVLLLDPGKLRGGSDKIQDEVVKVLEGMENVEFRFAEDMPLRGTIVDSRIAIFSVDEGKLLPFQKEIGITENENMASALTLYFEALWDKAKEL
ncbi:MAG: helix-turn-helix domain-containing protein [Candidatus Hydrothermarchaeales archaeon]